MTLGVSDPEAALAFYRTLLGEPGLKSDDLVEWNDFGFSPAGRDRPVTRGLHVALAAGSRDEVDQRWRAAIDAGFNGDGDPGPRPAYGPSYYGGFLRDPDGNSIEVVHRDQVRRDADVDHIWIRVANADASRTFYDAVADEAGLRLVEHVPGEHVHYTSAADGRSALRLLTSDEAATPVHLAFGNRGPAGVSRADPDGHIVETSQPAR